ICTGTFISRTTCSSRALWRWRPRFPMTSLPFTEVNLRPLVLPIEHGGWGILLEPLLLRMLVPPSPGGAVIALASLFVFLARQPLKLAMQDAIRHRSFARTLWCWMFAAWFIALAMMSIGFAIALSGWRFVVPFVLVSPLAIVVLTFDAR